MPIFRRRKAEQFVGISIDESTKKNNRSDVLDTIESLEIPRKRLIVVGSSVLALAGLERHAHDVDIILDPEHLDNLHDSGQLPSSLAVSEATFSRLQRRHFSAATEPLPSELFSHRSPLYPETFEDYLDNMTTPLRQLGGIIDPTKVPEDLRVINPGVLFANRMNRLHIGTPQQRAHKIAQDAYDRDLIIRSKLSQRR